MSKPATATDLRSFRDTAGIIFRSFKNDHFGEG
jgi:hypothetical protein